MKWINIRNLRYQLLPDKPFLKLHLKGQALKRIPNSRRNRKLVRLADKREWEDCGISKVLPIRYASENAGIIARMNREFTTLEVKDFFHIHHNCFVVQHSWLTPEHEGPRKVLSILSFSDAVP